MRRVHARYVADPDDVLIQRHATLIERAARRIASRTGGAVSPDDLWSAGAVGLLEASRRFDAGRDVSFEQFAEHRIKGAMLDELRRIDHLPRRLRDDLGRVETARAKLAQSLGRDPEASEIAEDLGVDLEELHAVQALGMPHVDLEHGALLPAEGMGADDVVLRRQQLQAVSGAVATLPERLQLVLSLHYVEGLTYREIARVLDVSEPRVCQLHGEAMKLVRGSLGGAE